MTAFFDTNIVIYAVSDDEKAQRARAALRQRGRISVQVLNEAVNVLRRKSRADWQVVEQARQEILSAFPDPLPLTLATHEAAVTLSSDHHIHIYDALIVAAALEARCRTLYSEDMQHGRKIGGVTIVNPFL